MGRALRPEINALCAELRPHALALVDAFAIPDAVVGAPIGRREAGMEGILEVADSSR